MTHRIENNKMTQSIKGEYPLNALYLAYVEKHLPISIKKLSKDEISYFIILAFSIMKRESTFDPKKVNKLSKAVGLMQLMPDTARWVEDKWFNGKRHNLKDPESNIKLGLMYLAYLYEGCGGRKYQTKILSSWNAGPKKTEDYINNNNGRSLIEVINRKNEETSKFVVIVPSYFSKYEINYGKKIQALAAKHSKPSNNDRYLKTKSPLSLPKSNIHHVAVAQKLTKKLTISSKVQVASLSNYEMAKLLRANFPGQNVRIERTFINTKTVYRVHVCFESVKQAEKFLFWARTNGYKDAWMLG